MTEEYATIGSIVQPTLQNLEKDRQHPLRVLRKLRHRTTEDMAQRCKVDRQRYVSIESGRTRPTTDFIVRAAKTLGVPYLHLSRLMGHAKD